MPKIPRKKIQVSVDTECTGLDTNHGARPFLVTTCNAELENTWWEWPVIPETRKVSCKPEDLDEIQRLLDCADEIVLQNAKFDYEMLCKLFADRGREFLWDWNKVHDTLIAGHLLASNSPHDLTSMVLQYLDVDVQPYENEMKEIVLEARRWAKNNREEWRIAKVGLPEMPSARSGKTKAKAKGAEETGPWKYDCWLPRLVIEEGEGEPTWETVTAEYANVDSSSTMALWQVQKQIIKERGLWKIYLERMKVLPVVCKMEAVGVTINCSRTTRVKTLYGEAAESYGRVCKALSGGLIEEMPKGGNSNAVKETVFTKFGLISSKKTKKGQPSMDKYVLDDWIATLPPHSKAAVFIRNLRDYRQRKNALGDIASYEKFWLPHKHFTSEAPLSEWASLFPSVNITGTNTLRFSSSNPNSQQFSKQEIAITSEEGYSLRYCLGPGPGREWYSLDAANIELRIPAYEAGEQAMIALFEKPDEPPYFGSNHLFFFNILHPEKWDHDDPEGLLKAKKEFVTTWYAWTKNGDFAVQYGAQESSGTADRTYHVPGAQAKIEKKLQQIKKLSNKLIEQAGKTGYVETLPDKTVDPNRGYPLICRGNKWGHGISPTIPLNYHVQGTAMQWMCKAMVRCQAYIDNLNATRKPERYIYIVLQVHDELVFDLPKDKPNRNKQIVDNLRKLMEQGGDDIGIPTPVNIEYHPNNWGESVSLN